MPCPPRGSEWCSALLERGKQHMERCRNANAHRPDAPPPSSLPTCLRKSYVHALTRSSFSRPYQREPLIYLPMSFAVSGQLWSCALPPVCGSMSTLAALRNTKRPNKRFDKLLYMLACPWLCRASPLPVTACQLTHSQPPVNPSYPQLIHLRHMRVLWYQVMCCGAEHGP
jgi:hypothetical protein